MTQQELWERMFSDKRLRAFATLKHDVVLSKWNGHGANPEFTDVPMSRGSRVRVVMASRFGDVGITDDLTAIHGYHLRVQCVGYESKMCGPITPDDTLEDIEVSP